MGHGKKYRAAAQGQAAPTQGMDLKTTAALRLVGDCGHFLLKDTVGTAIPASYAQPRAYL
jgi:hypothetical protein